MNHSLINPIEAMQAAVDIVGQSPHPTNKIAASLFNDRTLITRTNDYPSAILKNIGTETRIGNSSGSVHAEVNAILEFPMATHDASLCITDPFCPNCAKNIAEAGIKNIYIDHKGFEKDFFIRNDDEFEHMSLRIIARAGINVYKVERKENHITPIHLAPDDFRVIEDNPIKIREIGEHCTIKDWNNKNRIIHPRWGSAIARNDDGESFGMIASAHPAIGYSKEIVPTALTGKYNFYTEPLNRLLMGAKRYGLMLDPAQIYMAQVPTAREFVNFIAAGFNHLIIEDITHGRDDDSIRALALLQKYNVIRLS